MGTNLPSDASQLQVPDLGTFQPAVRSVYLFRQPGIFLPIYTAKACQDGRIVPVISSGANRSANREGCCLGVARRRAVPNKDLIVAVTDNSSREEVSSEGPMFRDRTETALNGRREEGIGVMFNLVELEVMWSQKNSPSQ
jgi:hypothetical protein